jgi:type II restriction enzyme
MVVGVKRTCKDRWRQVLNEGKRIPVKHLLTIQEAISSDQLAEMKMANVTLIVPKAYHKDYDKTVGTEILSVEEFITASKAIISP